MANIGPSPPTNLAISPVAKLPDSQVKRIAQKSSPIKSVVIKLIVATWKTFSGLEHRQQTRRAKYISAMQWSIQHLDFNF